VNIVVFIVFVVMKQGTSVGNNACWR